MALREFATRRRAAHIDTVSAGRQRASGAFFALLGCLALFCALFGLGCRRGPTERGLAGGESLLEGRSPSIVKGVDRPGRINDGVVARDGDFWRTELSSVLQSPGAHIDFDLGEVKPIGAAYIVGDNDDHYIIAGSTDGQSFSTIFEAGQVNGAGMRPRSSANLHASARYLRLRATGGDGSYAVSELAVYSSRPSVFPPQFVVRDGTPVFEALHPKIVFFGLALGLFVLVAYRGAPLYLRLGFFLPLAATAYLFYEVWPERPLPLLEQSILRATVAGVALFALAREVLSPPKFRVRAAVTLGTLALVSFFSVACYYNLFVPQFFDRMAGERTFVHPFDMRVYYPVAKYFDELRFDGLYFACVAAYYDDEPDAIPGLAQADIRDLRDHKMRKVAEVEPQIREAKSRFSPERWEAFRDDMRYFRLSMGRHEYLWSLTDHGGNATPVWLMVGHFLFRSTHASATTLVATGLLDPLLLVLLFAVVWRTYGLRTMLVSLVVFGATDFYMFGSDFAGSTLRQDWLVAAGLGACALKKERWLLGGALLAYGGLIRAFPAMTVAFVAMPLVVALFEHYYKSRKLLPWSELEPLARPVGQTLLGAAVTVALLVGVSAALFPAGTWTAWLHKVQLLSKDAHLNHVGWRTLIMYDPDTTFAALAHDSNAKGWQELQFDNFDERRSLYYLGVAAFGALAALACRKRRIEEAALIGLTMVPVIFYPANYYCHFIFLLPLAFSREFTERTGLASIWGWTCLLGICVAQYYTLEHGNTDLCFVGQSAIMLVAFIAMLYPDARQAYADIFSRAKAKAGEATEPAAKGA